MLDPEALVREFCAAWSRRDIDALLGYFTDDAVYHNMPMAPVSGKNSIREVLNMFVPGADAIEFEMLRVAARGSVVFAERVDRFRMGGKQVEVPVVGVFEIRNGRIAAWRDYFDFATWQRQVG
jgi:limonene-1,2-epoxide hydrolase